MAKKDARVRKTIKTSHNVDSGYIHGSHRIVDVIELLQKLLTQHGPEAVLDVSVENYDGYGAEIAAYVNTSRLENDEEYTRRMKKLDASLSANKARQTKRQQKAEEKARRVEEQERAELERLMKKYK